MELSTHFYLERSGYWVKRLAPQDAEVLQQLYEQCREFLLLTDGVPPSPTAAREEFDDVPEGKTPEDNYIFGLFDRCNILFGAIAGMRHYPDDRTWWIGLMMLAPEYRNQGLGADFYRAFEGWVAAQGISQISLCAIAENEQGLKFWKKMGFDILRKTPPRQFKAKTHTVYVLSRTIDRYSSL